MTDDLEEQDEPVSPPPIDFQPVEGAEDLPDDVKNGDPEEAPDVLTLEKPV